MYRQYQDLAEQYNISDELVYFFLSIIPQGKSSIAFSIYGDNQIRIKEDNYISRNDVCNMRINIDPYFSKYTALYKGRNNVSNYKDGIYKLPESLKVSSNMLTYLVYSDLANKEDLELLFGDKKITDELDTNKLTINDKKKFYKCIRRMDLILQMILINDKKRDEYIKWKSEGAKPEDVKEMLFTKKTKRANKIKCEESKDSNLSIYFNVENDKIKFIRSILPNYYRRMIDGIYGNNYDFYDYKMANFFKNEVTWTNIIDPYFKRMFELIDFNHDISNLYLYWKQIEYDDIDIEQKQQAFSEIKLKVNKAVPIGVRTKTDDLVLYLGTDADHIGFMVSKLNDNQRDVLYEVQGNNLFDSYYNDNLEEKIINSYKVSVLRKMQTISSSLKSDKYLSKDFDDWLQRRESENKKVKKIWL